MSDALDPRPYAPAAPLPQPCEAPLTGPVELYGERHSAEPVVYVPDAYGRMVPVLRSQADAMLAAMPATAPRDLAPQPLIDSRAQLVIASGIGTGAAAAGVGWGLGQILAPLAAITSSGLLWAVCLAAVIARTGRRAVRGGNTYVTHTHVRAAWWGRASSTTRN